MMCDCAGVGLFESWYESSPRETGAGVGERVARRECVGQVGVTAPTGEEDPIVSDRFRDGDRMLALELAGASSPHDE